LAAGFALAFQSAPATPRRCPLRCASALSIRSLERAHGNALIALLFSGFCDKFFWNQEVYAMLTLIGRSGRKGRGEARTK
jgi:hypothetical protein